MVGEAWRAPPPHCPTHDTPRAGSCPILQSWGRCLVSQCPQKGSWCHHVLTVSPCGRSSVCRGGSQCSQGQSWCPQEVVVSHGGRSSNLPRACLSGPGGTVFTRYVQYPQGRSWCLHQGPGDPRGGPGDPRGILASPRGVLESPATSWCHQQGSQCPQGWLQGGSQCPHHLLVHVPAPEDSSLLLRAQCVQLRAVLSAHVLLLPHPTWATLRRMVVGHHNRVPQGLPQAPLGSPWAPLATVFTPGGETEAQGAR